VDVNFDINCSKSFGAALLKPRAGIATRHTICIVSDFSRRVTRHGKHKLNYNIVRSALLVSVTPGVNKMRNAESQPSRPPYLVTA